MAEQNLNAQQIAAVNEEFKKHVAGVIEKLGLRRWAAEVALAEKGNSDPIKLAQQLYDFVIAPALEPFKPD